MVFGGERGWVWNYGCGFIWFIIELGRVINLKILSWFNVFCCVVVNFSLWFRFRSVNDVIVCCLL